MTTSPKPSRNFAMTDLLDGVRDHYRASGLTERLKTALAALGPEDQQLTPQELASVDQFHTRGLAATAELAELAGMTADMWVLDVGSGVGGPARFWPQHMAVRLRASTSGSYSSMPRAIRRSGRDRASGCRLRPLARWTFRSTTAISTPC
jgi:hypothetical protein